MKLLSVEDSMFIFLVHWYRDGCSAICFVKYIQTFFVQVFSLLHNTVRMHEFLLCCESSRKCCAMQTTLTTKIILIYILYVFTKLLLYSHRLYNSLFRRFEYAEGSLFRRFIIPKVRYSEGSLFRSPLFRRFVIPKVRYSEGSLGSFVIPKVRYSEGSLVRK